MTCSEFRSQLQQAIDAGSANSLLDELTAHRMICQSCAAYTDAILALDIELRSVKREIPSTALISRLYSIEPKKKSIISIARQDFNLLRAVPLLALGILPVAAEWLGFPNLRHPLEFCVMTIGFTLFLTMFLKTKILGITV
jgi:hypothetical protein